MNYYVLLGLPPSCSPSEIKAAYRKLVKTHHPDAGGDPYKFIELVSAYDILSDPYARAAYDIRTAPKKSPNIRDNVYDDLHTIFGNQYNQRREYSRTIRNKSLAITIELSLEDILVPHTKTLSVTHLNNTRKFVSVKIPAGVASGTKIKYAGLGDASISGVDAGDLTITIIVNEHKKFIRNKNNLILHFTISAWDAIIGTTANITTLENKILNVNIPAGIQYGTILKVTGHGLVSKANVRGDLLMHILIKIPENLTEEQLNICTKLRGDK